MSASAWKTCPKCAHEQEKGVRALRQNLKDSYGVVSQDEYEVMRHEAWKPVERLDYTFREDYEIFGAADGEITVSYSGKCEKCGCGTNFTYKHKFYERD